MYITDVRFTDWEKGELANVSLFYAGERVGCLSAVNQQLSEEGLMRVIPLSPLVSETHAPLQKIRASSVSASRPEKKELLKVGEVYGRMYEGTTNYRAIGLLNNVPIHAIN